MDLFLKDNVEALEADGHAVLRSLNTRLFLVTQLAKFYHDEIAVFDF